MICPKCQNQMQVVDKDGVHIDQCTECRGIFLDRGELEQIARAEKEFYAAAAPPPYQPDSGAAAPMRPAPPVQPPVQQPMMRPGPGYADSPRPYRGGYADSPRPYGGYGSHGSRGHGRRRRKEGFLENLLDFG